MRPLRTTLETQKPWQPAPGVRPAPAGPCLEGTGHAHPSPEPYAILNPRVLGAAELRARAADLAPPVPAPVPRTILFQRKRANRRIMNEERFIDMLREFGEVRPPLPRQKSEPLCPQAPDAPFSLYPKPCSGRCACQNPKTLRSGPLRSKTQTLSSEPWSLNPKP